MIIYKIASKLSKYPHIKRFLKDGYQMMGALLSDKKTSPNTIQCVSDQKYENLFGYYDKSPWNADGNKMIYLRVNNADKKYVSNEPAAIILKDLSDNTEDIIAYSNSWNVQQGCMLQWLGPGFDSDILYNDFRDGRYCSIILNLETLKEKIIDFPVYAVSNDGKTAISLDFSRLNTLRPGYGYCNITDLTINESYND